MTPDPQAHAPAGHGVVMRAAQHRRVRPPEPQPPTIAPAGRAAARGSIASRLAALRDRLLLQEDLNFLLTNRIPRQAATRFMGWFSRIRHPWVCGASIAVWRLFTPLDLSDARRTRFESLHDCFTRELRPGARTVDPRPGVLASPCDAIVGAMGTVHAGSVLQAKGFPYRLQDLFGSTVNAVTYEGGSYVTLRLTSSMYHRFHAPCDARLEHVTYISGDTWNVNPVALRRVQRLFCRNERVVLRLRQDSGEPLALVAVAAVLVASVRLHALDVLLHLRWPGPNEMPCNHAVRRGEELGWFEHGSTIIVFAPPGCTPAEGISTGAQVRMGQALLHRPMSGSAG